MSYDLAVWEGERPADDKTAGRVFGDLYDRYAERCAQLLGRGLNDPGSCCHAGGPLQFDLTRCGRHRLRIGRQRDRAPKARPFRVAALDREAFQLA
ncbi:hypothetical protein YW3DRAFT_05816 [Streptomyces sp. MnatMP-M77]|nr:hypothetical protein [Streptomyces sp. SID8364]SBU96601.1 hypothetical protein YW3DRAFT_05816 [Streptomyces sp. MnatMP-M77]